MGLHISAIILTEWLLIAGWFSGENLYNLGALIVVVVWGISWRRDEPRWPRNRLIQVFIYASFGLLTWLVYFLTKTSLASLIASLIFIFGIIDFTKSKSQ